MKRGRSSGRSSFPERLRHRHHGQRLCRDPHRPPVGTYTVQASVTDKAGNTGTISTQPLNIAAVSVPWGVAYAGIGTVDACGCNSQQQFGTVQNAVNVFPRSFDEALGPFMSPNLLYNSNLALANPLPQLSLQSNNESSMPASLTATLTWDGTAQTPATYATIHRRLGAPVPGSAQCGTRSERA